jgi:hypothetical protein
MCINVIQLQGTEFSFPEQNKVDELRYYATDLFIYLHLLWKFYDASHKFLVTSTILTFEIWSNELSDYLSFLLKNNSSAEFTSSDFNMWGRSAAKGINCLCF